MGNREEMNLKILFITQEDPFYVRLFFEEFFKTYGRLDEIKGVSIGRTLGKKGFLDMVRQVWMFYGPWDFIRMGMRYCAIKALGVLQDPWNRNGRSPLARLCETYGIRPSHQDNVNGGDYLKTLREMDLDLIISVAAPVVFKSELLGVARHGCINIHSAKLPSYRGMMPVFWQMYHDEKRVGITVHEMNPKLDDGRIVVQEEVPIDPGESLESLIRRTKKKGAHLMIEAIERIRTGRVRYAENPEEEGSYFSFPTKRDVKQFREKGYRIL